MTAKILTATGREFDFDNLHWNTIEIDDISHALSNMCRFTGHTKDFYSVAQHSYMVSTIVPREHALAALIHDVHEAYIGDVSAPLKTLLPDFCRLERRVEIYVRRRFGLGPDLHSCVKTADLVMLSTELRDLMPHFEHEWDFQYAKGFAPLEDRLTAWTSAHAKAKFLERYAELTE